MTIDPPEGDWPSFKTLANVMIFAGLAGEPADKDTIAGSLCYLLGSDGSDHPRVFALKMIFLSCWRNGRFQLWWVAHWSCRTPPLVRLDRARL